MIDSSRLTRKKELERRTMMFAVAVFRLLRKLPASVDTRVIGYQIGKSASSIGANYREANRSESRDDFAHKIGVVLKEASETVYWLEILSELYPDDDALSELRSECNEFVRIFQSANRSIRTKSKTITK